MARSESGESGRMATRFHVVGIPVLFLTGGFMHFLYNLTGKMTIVGFFTPVNESVWEHLKMAFLPVLFWWLAGYYLLKSARSLSFPKWFLCCIVSEYICSVTILSSFYTYTCALGFDSVVIDILLLLLGLTAGQFLALHIFHTAKIKNTKAALISAMVLFILLAAVFIVFTVYPPHLPLFLDTSSGTYGI